VPEPEVSLLLIEVAVPIPGSGPLTYAVPPSLRSRVLPGQRVRVRLGKRRVTGLIWALAESPPAGIEPREIESLLDLEPALPEELLELARFTSAYYLAGAGDVVAAMLPQDLPAWGDQTVELTPGGAMAALHDPGDEALRSTLLAAGRIRRGELLLTLPAIDLNERLDRWLREGWLSDRASATRRHYSTGYRLAPGGEEELLARCGRSFAAREVVKLLAALRRQASAAELREATGASDAVLRRLAGLGVLLQFRQAERLDLERHLMRPRREDAAPIQLSPQQEVALAALREALDERKFRSFLLQGVTGSGKTEVYLRAAENILARGGSAILLVPEIALVPALARAALARFAGRVAVLHSGLGTAERQQEWDRIRRGEARIVVGARSALFAPVRELALIVVDEEQDSAYKQETAPRYHGRDLALVRCRQAGAVALLVSATPSFEARHAAASGRSGSLRLADRTGSARLPEGILVDLRAEPRTPRAGELVFSGRLLEEIAATLAAGDQVILLRNRRGYAPVLLCRACGEDFRCDDCGLPRTWHRRDARLVCHWCGSTRPVPLLCPKCGAEALEAVGSGTERVEETLRELFPGVAIDVLDRDATRRVGSAAAILERFGAGETRLLVGTQMLSKGHHFPGVALTAVLSADALLGFPDFRAVERTYALLTQLAGRAGRGERPGRVVLQTYHPEHYAIQAALRNDDAVFVEQEMRFRRVFDYPPFTRLALVLVRDSSRERGLARIQEFAERLRLFRGAHELRLTGPAPAPLERLKGEWRFHLLARCSSGNDLRAALRGALDRRADPALLVDVDPYQLL
jgi:primosomal protein N' (replication factor Y)